MPSSPKVTNENTSEEPDFVLKHRIAGAGFLLFFGALFLPWLLGAPSDASKVKESAQSSISGSNLEGSVSSSSDGGRSLDAELLSAIENEEIDRQALGEEQVYISKITPLDAQSESSISAQQKSQAKASSGGANASVQTKKAEPVVADGGSSDTKKPKKQPVVANTKGADQASKESQKVANNTLKDFNKKSESIAIATPEKMPPAVKPVASKKPSVDVGWIVQVGVFTDKKGAARVVDDLKSKGFDPSTSIVDTNRGKATGTRIWLGPYAQRVAAAKAKTQLTSKTGEAGFIRAYP